MADSSSIESAINNFLLTPAYHDILSIVKAARNGAMYGTKVRFPHALVMITLFKSGTLREKIRGILGATRAHATNLATFAILYKSVMLILKTVPTPTKKIHPAPGGAPNLPKRLEASPDTFFAGCVAGYFIFGRPSAANSSVNQQIVIYVFARVCLALARLLVLPPERAPTGYQAGYSARSRPGGGMLEGLVAVSGFGNGADGIKDKRLVFERAALVRAFVQRHAWAGFASLSWGMVMWLFRWHPEELQPSLRSSMKYIYEASEHWDGWKNFIWHNT